MDIDALLLYIDDALVVVNKPAGLRVIPDGYNPTLPYLAGLLQASLGRVWVVHRLDKDTSGAMLFARTPEAHRMLNQQFEQRQTHKEYHAICAGVPEWERSSITYPLRVDGDRRHRTIIDHQTGKPAETSVEVIQTFAIFCLLKAQPHSGYTHQIRAHLASVNLPILADPLYKSLQPETLMAKKAAEISAQLPIKRTALHAFSIRFDHPVSGRRMTHSAPYPPDFEDTITELFRLQYSVD